MLIFSCDETRRIFANTLRHELKMKETLYKMGVDSGNYQFAYKSRKTADSERWLSKLVENQFLYPAKEDHHLELKLIDNKVVNLDGKKVAWEFSALVKVDEEVKMEGAWVNHGSLACPIWSSHS
ncbi:hypothetical protein [Kiloniella sp.]|uniref:hypothetical protein n=1 Tax=Kiloniella sp. TaxID=1938587 RepID=UPI003B02CB70